MFVKISKNNILRTPGKTLLFTLLITSLTLLLFLCVFTYSQTLVMAEQYEHDYITIAEVECPTGMYGDFDSSDIISDPYVLDWQPNVHLIGLAEGFSALDYPPYPAHAVAVVGNIFYDDHLGTWTATVRQVLSSDYDIDSKMIYIDPGAVSFSPEPKNSYIIHGVFGPSPSMMKSVTLAPISFDPDLSDVVPYALADGTEPYSGDSNDPFVRSAYYYNLCRSSVDICPVRSTDSNLLFHQKTVFITSGRAFMDYEYKNGEHVCIVSEKLAAYMKLSVGDILPLTVLGEVMPKDVTLHEYTDYTIVGIISTELEILHYIYVPEAAVLDAQAVLPVNSGSLLGQAVIKNGSTDAFLYDMGESLPASVVLTVYDHGYESVVKVLASLRLLSLILSIVCAAVCAVVLVLYAYLFVARQHETVQTMLFLGTPRRGIFTYLMFGSGLISFLAALAGALIGLASGAQVFTFVWRLFSSLTSVDSRFSNTSVGVIIEQPLSPHVSPLLCGAVFLAVFAVSLLFCALFAAGTFEKRKKKRGLRRTVRIPRPPRHSSMLPPSPLRFALISLRRGGRRSAVVPCLSLVMVIFLCTVAFLADSGDSQIRDIYDNTVIRGHITDLAGKKTQGLSIPAENLEAVADSGFVTDTSRVIDDVYKYLGVVEYADGSAGNVEEFIMPVNYALETFLDNLYAGPSVVLTDNLLMSPEFITITPAITFADGYDAGSFTNPEWQGDIPCLVTDSFAAANGVAVGDTIRIILTGMINRTRFNTSFNLVNVRVVGTYINPQGVDTLYLPLPKLPSREDMMYIHLNYFAALLESFDSSPERISLTFGGFNYTASYFKLSDTRSIDRFKEYLETEGFSYPGHTGRIRMSVQLEDRQFYESMRSARQQTQYMKVLFPLLFIVAGAVGVAVSFLMTGARREELAIMRGCGASAHRTFLSLFLEAAILCAAGGIVAWLIFLAFGGGAGIRFWLCLPGFLLCYLSGSAASIGRLARSGVSEILKTKE